MKSKLFSPRHEYKPQSPLGEQVPYGPWPEDDERFNNTQDVPRYSTFGAGEIRQMPSTPLRRK